MSIQLFSFLLICFGSISLQSAQITTKKPVSLDKKPVVSLEEFKKAVVSVTTPRQNGVSFSSSPTSSGNSHSDRTKDKQTK